MDVHRVMPRKPKGGGIVHFCLNQKSSLNERTYVLAVRPDVTRPFF
jgi:hypothetical protein